MCNIHHFAYACGHSEYLTTRCERNPIGFASACEKFSPSLPRAVDRNCIPCGNAQYERTLEAEAEGDPDHKDDEEDGDYNDERSERYATIIRNMSSAQDDRYVGYYQGRRILANQHEEEDDENSTIPSYKVPASIDETGDDSDDWHGQANQRPNEGVADDSSKTFQQGGALFPPGPGEGGYDDGGDNGEEDEEDDHEGLTGLGGSNKGWA